MIKYIYILKQKPPQIWEKLQMIYILKAGCITVIFPSLYKVFIYNHFATLIYSIKSNGARFLVATGVEWSWQ